MMNKTTEYIVLAFIGVVICDKLIFPAKPRVEVKYVTKTEVKTEVHTVYVESKKNNVSTKSVTEKLNPQGSVVERTTTSTLDLTTTNLNLGVDTTAHSNSETSYSSIKDHTQPSWLIGVNVLNIVKPVSLDNIGLQLGYRPLGNLWVLGSTTLSWPLPVVSLGVALTL